MVRPEVCFSFVSLQKKTLIFWRLKALYKGEKPSQNLVTASVCRRLKNTIFLMF
jgi:hypothetical protein